MFAAVVNPQSEAVQPIVCYGCGDSFERSARVFKRARTYTYILCGTCPQEVLPALQLGFDRHIDLNILGGLVGVLDVDERPSHSKWTDRAWGELKTFLPATVNQKAFISFSIPDGFVGVAVETDAEGRATIDNPMAALLSLEAITAGAEGVVVVRSFDSDTAFISPDGIPVPYKTVRAWIFNDLIGDPVTAEALELNYSIDAETGEALTPEAGVRYAASWLLTGNPGGGIGDLPENPNQQH